MTRGNRDDEESKVGGGFVAQTMRCSRSDHNRLVGCEPDSFMFQLHRRSSLKDEEKLTGDAVEMAFLAFPGRDTFEDHAHILAVQQMPSVASVPPHIVPGVVSCDWFDHADGIVQEDRVSLGGACLPTCPPKHCEGGSAKHEGRCFSTTSNLTAGAAWCPRFQYFGVTPRL